MNLMVCAVGVSASYELGFSMNSYHIQVLYF